MFRKELRTNRLFGILRYNTRLALTRAEDVIYSLSAVFEEDASFTANAASSGMIFMVTRTSAQSELFE